MYRLNIDSHSDTTNLRKRSITVDQYRVLIKSVVVRCTCAFIFLTSVEFMLTRDAKSCQDLVTD